MTDAPPGKYPTVIYGDVEAEPREHLPRVWILVEPGAGDEIERALTWVGKPVKAIRLAEGDASSHGPGNRYFIAQFSTRFHAENWCAAMGIRIVK